MATPNRRNDLGQRRRRDVQGETAARTDEEPDPVRLVERVVHLARDGGGRAATEGPALVEPADHRAGDAALSLAQRR